MIDNYDIWHFLQDILFSWLCFLTQPINRDHSKLFAITADYVIFAGFVIAMISIKILILLYSNGFIDNLCETVLQQQRIYVFVVTWF